MVQSSVQPKDTLGSQFVEVVCNLTDNETYARQKKRVTETASTNQDVRSEAPDLGPLAPGSWAHLSKHSNSLPSIVAKAWKKHCIARNSFLGNSLGPHNNMSKKSTDNLRHCKNVNEENGAVRWIQCQTQCQPMASRFTSWNPAGIHAVGDRELFPKEHAKNQWEAPLYIHAIQGHSANYLVDPHQNCNVESA